MFEMRLHQILSDQKWDIQPKTISHRAGKYTINLQDEKKLTRPNSNPKLGCKLENFAVVTPTERFDLKWVVVQGTAKQSITNSGIESDAVAS